MCSHTLPLPSLALALALALASLSLSLSLSRAHALSCAHSFHAPRSLPGPCSISLRKSPISARKPSPPALASSSAGRNRPGAPTTRPCPASYLGNSRYNVCFHLGSRVGNTKHQLLKTLWTTGYHETMSRGGTRWHQCIHKPYYHYVYTLSLTTPDCPYNTSKEKQKHVLRSLASSASKNALQHPCLTRMRAGIGHSNIPAN